MLRQSRDVLRRFGNMSSATVMFVLKEMLQPGTAAGRGCAMAFGPGLTAESMLFQTAES
jgi:predicted naringenin-chalcone synthase